MILKKKIILLILTVILILLIQCGYNDKDKRKGSNSTISNKDNVLGYGFLKRIPGLWNGPVVSTTQAGNFDVWYVDFRPVSQGQVSEYSTYSFKNFNNGVPEDKTLNYISFFIVKHDNRLKVAMRTEASAFNQKCITYEIIDKVKESKGYYRFSDFQAGADRAYTEFTFKDDQLTMEVYTNKFNMVYPVQVHSVWIAKCGDRNAPLEAISYFNYPQPVMVEDFTDAFKNLYESIFYTDSDDPFYSATQPYVGNVTVNISIDSNLTVNNNCELCLLLTTESLFDGLIYKEENLKYISRYAYLPVDVKSFTFDYIHPGKYYLYSYCDINGDKKHLSGDYMSSNFNNTISLSANGNVVVDTTIDFVIP